MIFFEDNQRCDYEIEVNQEDFEFSQEREEGYFA